MKSRHTVIERVSRSVLAAALAGSYWPAQRGQPIRSIRADDWRNAPQKQVAISARGTAAVYPDAR